MKSSRILSFCLVYLFKKNNIANMVKKLKGKTDRFTFFKKLVNKIDLFKKIDEYLCAA